MSRFATRGALSCVLAAMVGAMGCHGRGDPPEIAHPEPVLRRLTQQQYTRSIHDVLGDSVVVPTSLEPDAEAGGLTAIGASLTSISPRGVEQYETAAYQVAGQVMTDPDLRARDVPCAPAGTVDDACADQFVREAGLRLWRRPLTDAETAGLVAIAGQAATTLGDFHQGLEYALAALLQSPDFLFRVEIGEPDPASPGAFRYTGYELASRLSYLLWNTTPDDELLAAAGDGSLLDDAGLSAEVDRLIADPRSRDGVREFFTEMLRLGDLDALNKDPLVFTHMSADVGPSAREETLLGLEAIIYDDDGDGDVRDFMTTHRTFVNRKLAAIYGIPAPAIDGFAETTLPEDGGRRGFTGQVSFLANNAHPANTSVTLRGKFVREVLFCQPIPPPPANLNTAIPEPSPDAPTMRDRVAVHLQDPFCAGCHTPMDTVGLGFENFDGLGGWRTTENVVQIDPSGDVDGAPYANADALAQVIHDKDALPNCIAQTWVQYAEGHVMDTGEWENLRWHEAGFADEGYRMRFLMRDVAMSPAFRAAGEVQP